MHRQLLGVTCLFSWMLSLPVLAQDTHYSPALTSSIEIIEQHRIIPEELKKFIPEPDRFKYLPKELQNRLIVQLKEMIDAEKVWAQQIATPTESSFPDQQSSRSQFEKNIEQISSTLLSQYPLHQKFEKLSSHRTNLEAQFQKAIEQGDAKLVWVLDAQLSGLESILLLMKLTPSMAKSVLDTTEFSAKNSIIKDLEMIPAVEPDSIAEQKISLQDKTSQNEEISLIPSLTEDPLGLDEDPFASSADVDELGLNEDPFAEVDTTEEDLGLNENPFTDGAGEDPLGLDEDPFAVAEPTTVILESSDTEGTPEKESRASVTEQQQEANDFQVKVQFSHAVTTTFGTGEIRGLYQIDPEFENLSEYTFGTTYEQKIHVQTSPKLYNYARLSVNFTQHYERNKEQFLDSYFTIREIYSNYQDEHHQLRWGTQIFELGKLDFDSPIDVLHLQEITALLSLDLENSKEALPSLRYRWLGQDQTVTLILLPLRPSTLGMRFTELRESMEAQEDGDRDDGSSLRDYFGLQYQWFASSYDLRFSYFHWFDQDSSITFDYEPTQEVVVENGFEERRSSFEKLADNYTERESKLDFLTLEGDVSWEGLVWKFDLGYFLQKNLYSYEIDENRNLYFRTVRSPYHALATSLETRVKQIFLLGAYSLRYFTDVPGNTHAVRYENKETLQQNQRQLARHQVSGIAVIPWSNEIQFRFVAYRTFPFEQTGLLHMTVWDEPINNTQWSLKFLRYITPVQKMLNSEVTATQIFISYRKQFHSS